MAIWWSRTRSGFMTVFYVGEAAFEWHSSAVF